MILLFHTGIVDRLKPEVPADISFDRMRATRLDLIARHWPKTIVIGAHLGNPDYAEAAEIARWNPNLYFDLSGSSLIKKKDDYGFFRSIFWWTGIVSPHTPSGGPDAFEKLVYGSDARCLPGANECAGHDLFRNYVEDFAGAAKRNGGRYGKLSAFVRDSKTSRSRHGSRDKTTKLFVHYPRRLH